MNKLRQIAQNLVTGNLPVTILVIFVCIFSQEATSQNISKHYVLSNQGENKLYFIYPQNGFKNGSTKLTFDITYLDSREYTTFNFTYTDKRSLEINSLSLIYDKGSVNLPAEKIYTESKSKWIYRLSVNVPFDTAHAFFKSEDVPQIQLKDKEEIINLNIKKGYWEKLSHINNRIFEIMRINKK